MPELPGSIVAVFLLVLGGAVMTINCDKPAATKPASAQPAAPARLMLSANDTQESLQQYVGREVVVSGSWGGPGKIGACIRAEGKGGEPIYVTAAREEAVHKLNRVQIKYGEHVELRGILHFYKMPPQLPKPPDDELLQIEPPHFYFDIEDVSFRFPM